MRFTCLKLELKRALKKLPYMIAGAIPLFLLAAVTAFLAARLLYGDEAVGRIRVGVSIPEGDVAAEQVIRLLESLDSVSSVCDFVYLDLDECMDGLRAGELFAAIEAPEGFVQGIINGTNTPVTIWLPRGNALEGQLFSALTDAGAQTLSASQAGIYAGNEIYALTGNQNLIAELERDLNQYYIGFSLARLDNFRRFQISGTGDLETGPFYMVSAFTLFLFFAAVPAGEYLLPHSRSMRSKLEIAGLGSGWREFCRVFGLTLLLMILSVPVLVAGLATGVLGMSWYLIPILFLVCMAVASLVILIYHVSGSLLGGLMFLFLVVAVQHFIAGGILPEVFLPDTLRHLAPWMPSGILMGAMKTAVLGQPQPSAFAAVCGIILVAMVLDTLLERAGK